MSSEQNESIVYLFSNLSLTNPWENNYNLLINFIDKHNKLPTARDDQLENNRLPTIRDTNSEE